MITYSEGIAYDGAVILRDGVPMLIEDVIRELNEYEKVKELLKYILDDL